MPRGAGQRTCAPHALPSQRLPPTENLPGLKLQPACPKRLRYCRTGQRKRVRNDSLSEGVRERGLMVYRFVLQQFLCFGACAGNANAVLLFSGLRQSCRVARITQEESDNDDVEINRRQRFFLMMVEAQKSGY
jgi:hypothetical protein